MMEIAHSHVSSVVQSRPLKLNFVVGHILANVHIQHYVLVPFGRIAQLFSYLLVHGLQTNIQYLIAIIFTLY